MDDRWTESQIDDVARALTQAPPAPDLRGRVLARISAGNHNRSWPMAVRLAPVAVVLVVAAALTVAVWPERPRDGESPVQSESNSTATGGRHAETPLPREPEASVVSQPGTSTSPPPRAASVPLQAPAVDSAVAIALAPEQLTVPAMDLDAVTTAESSALSSLEVTTINITRLEIEPIGSQAPAATPSRGY